MRVSTSSAAVVAEHDADVLVVEGVAPDEDAVADSVALTRQPFGRSDRGDVVDASRRGSAPRWPRGLSATIDAIEYRLRGAQRALRVWPDHRPAEPDLVHTSEGSRPADSTPSRIPGRRFSYPVGPRRHHRGPSQREHPNRIAALIVVVARHRGLRRAEPGPIVRRRQRARRVVAATASAPPSVPPEPATVRLALDWTPNTNHTGFYVARAEGLVRRGRRSTSRSCRTRPPRPETLLAAHQAECGISFQDAMTFAVAAGADIVSVMAILQKTASAIGVLADGPIQRPRDLDGKTYAGFGYPNEVPTLKAVIQADGGTGDFTVATLDARRVRGALQQAGRLHDPVHRLGGRRGRAARDRAALLPVRRLRLPRVLPGRPRLRPAVAGARAGRGPAVRRGDRPRLRARRRRPGRGGRHPRRREPGRVRCEPGAAAATRSGSSPRAGYLVDADGKVGRQTLERWQGYSGFLYEQGLLVDAAGKPLTAPLDYASLFTNDYLP